MEAPIAKRIGKIRSPAFVYVVSLATFGFYSIYWWYKVNDEVRKHDPAEIHVRPCRQSPFPLLE